MPRTKKSIDLKKAAGSKDTPGNVQHLAQELDAVVTSEATEAYDEKSIAEGEKKADKKLHPGKAIDLESLYKGKDTSPTVRRAESR